MSTSPPALVEIENVTKHFGPRIMPGGKTALDGVSFSVPAGQLGGLLGPNGAGKRDRDWIGETIGADRNDELAWYT